MVAIATSLIYHPAGNLCSWICDISIRCGLLSYPFLRQCEKPKLRVRQYVPAPYFILKYKELSGEQ